MKLFDPEEYEELKRVVRECTERDRGLLEEIRQEARGLKEGVRAIRARSTTAVSMVASDGGNNRLDFDPFHVQLVRVVDSNGKRLCVDAVSPSTNIDELSAAQFKPDGTPKTALGVLMSDLNINPPTLRQLSHMIPDQATAAEKPGWVLVYRDLCEWAVLYDCICHTRFGTNTLVVLDNLLRSKLFRGDGFIRMLKRVEEAIVRFRTQDRINVFLVGVAKHSKVITRYNLAMAVENILPPGEARFVHVPREIEKKAYVWPEYARGEEGEGQPGEAPKFVAGDMHFVRFGPRSGDPVWAIDTLSSQRQNAPEIFGYLLADAIVGFPVPYYPRCLQQAHQFAQIADFDLEILQDAVIHSVRSVLPQNERPALDALAFQTDVSARRYQ